MRSKLLLAIFLFCFCALNAQEISGFWQTMNKETNLPSSVIAVYSYKGKYYGRIIATYNSKGEIDDSIYNPVGKAEGLAGNPFYSGLDIVWADGQEDEGVYNGHVIDPRNGKVYRAELWREGENLILRGKLFIFGRNEVWPPFPEKNFNRKFKKPDLKTFVPKLPQSSS
jgi:uncharacterized protein (DUF2147 family)